MTSSHREVLVKHYQSTHHYLDNAASFLREGEVGKASEFLWGSMAQAVKLAAAWRGRTLRSHRDLWDYAESLAREMGDPTLFEAFQKANSLHSNFYEMDLLITDVALLARDIQLGIGKLINVLPRDVVRELAQDATSG